MSDEASNVRILEYSQMRNDLFASFECECPSKLYAETPVSSFFKEKITLKGYNDAYFFDVVNANPMVYTCSCGREYQYQWKRNGVEISSI